MKNVFGARELIVAGIALFSIAQLATTQAQEETSSGNAIAGQALYFDHACYGCHGYTGETGVRALVGSAYLQTEEIFRTYLRLRAEQNPLLPSTQMPNYSQESLSDEDVSDLYAYLRTFEGNLPDLEDIPVLNEIIEAASRQDDR